MALLQWDHFDIFHNSIPPIWTDWKWNSIMLSTALTVKSKKSRILIWSIPRAVTQIFSVVVRAAMANSGILWLFRVPLKAWPASLQSHVRRRSGISSHHSGTCHRAVVLPFLAQSNPLTANSTRRAREAGEAASHLRLASHSACEFTNLPTSNTAAQPGACIIPTLHPGRPRGYNPYLPRFLPDL